MYIDTQHISLLLTPVPVWRFSYL